MLFIDSTGNANATKQWWEGIGTKHWSPQLSNKAQERQCHGLSDFPSHCLEALGRRFGARVVVLVLATRVPEPGGLNFPRIEVMRSEPRSQQHAEVVGVLKEAVCRVAVEAVGVPRARTPEYKLAPGFPQSLVHCPPKAQ